MALHVVYVALFITYIYCWQLRHVPDITVRRHYIVISDNVHVTLNHQFSIRVFSEW